VYCVIHEALKSSPGLMVTVVETLVYRKTSDVQQFVTSLQSSGTVLMWGVLSAVSDMLPDKDAFNDRDHRNKCLSLLDKYLTARDWRGSMDGASGKS
jgi:hypothetical protein